MALPVVTRSASSTLETFGAGLTVAGAFAYLARGTLGLQVVDIRHPDAPRLAGRLPTRSQAVQVMAVGDRLYVLDRVTTLHVLQGPGADLTDTDGDGVIDFFNAFPTDPRETQDTDRDRLGDTTDPDDDNDGFPDAEEQQATPPTDPGDARSFLVRLPPAGTTTLVVDAASSLPASQRTGTPEAPYRALSEALQALRTGRLPQVHTVQVRAGTYAALTTTESDPLNRQSVPTTVLYGINRSRSELLVLNPDTGQATVIAGLATELLSLLLDIMWSPDSRTLYAHGGVGIGSLAFQDRLYTRLGKLLLPQRRTAKIHK